MLKQKKWSFLLTLVCLLMVFSTACNNGSKNATGSNSPSSGQNASAGTDKGTGGGTEGTITDWSKEPEVTLQVFSTLANYAGEQPGWFAKLVKDKFNIKLNIIQGSNDRVATQMASGSLGDLVVGMGGKNYTDSIKAGLVLDWTKNGLLDKYGKNMQKYAAQALEANRKQYGNDTAIYGIGNGVGNGDGPSEGATMTFGPYLRWDLYQKLGSPGIKTLDDYLPILKQMQELQPTSESGKKTYGFSLWSDWDGDFSTLAKVTAQFYGYAETDGFNSGDLVLVKADEAKYQPILDENSYYMKGLKFYFDANQMGLLDPDSLTQKFGDVSNKIKDGQVLFAQFPWLTNVYNTPNHTAEGKGFALVPFSEEQIYSNGFNPYGSGWIWSIGAKTKYPERVMAFLDWMYSPEGVEEGFYGQKGMAWDVDASGKPTLTELGQQTMYNQDTPVPDQYGGGIWSDGAGNFGKLNNVTLALSSINPETSEPYDFNLWNSTLTRNPDPVTKSWREAMGVLTDKEWFVKHNQVAIAKPFFNGQAPAEEPADIKLKHSQVGKVIKEFSWKMMLAKNQAEFDSLKQQMIKKAKGLGYDDVINWELEQTKNTVFTMYK
ncbi:ABC transporter substrate-binding protein [Gorillibacterium massiliense]|uniref:ABC transporter substrate-binding protein n=1 Tax=Gorillibacterium massiliense TaxID=1280390 RepID=UPI0004BC41EC|nr:ABC transporter substrate-binding protein [Gorillibacterium massiliense]